MSSAPLPTAAYIAATRKASPARSKTFEGRFDEALAEVSALVSETSGEEQKFLSDYCVQIANERDALREDVRAVLVSLEAILLPPRRARSRLFGSPFHNATEVTTSLNRLQELAGGEWQQAPELLTELVKLGALLEHTKRLDESRRAQDAYRAWLQRAEDSLGWQALRTLLRLAERLAECGMHEESGRIFERALATAPHDRGGLASEHVGVFTETLAALSALRLRDKGTWTPLPSLERREPEVAAPAPPVTLEQSPVRALMNEAPARWTWSRMRPAGAVEDCCTAELRPKYCASLRLMAAGSYDAAQAAFEKATQRGSCCEDVVAAL